MNLKKKKKRKKNNSSVAGPTSSTCPVSFTERTWTHTRRWDAHFACLQQDRHFHPVNLLTLQCSKSSPQTIYVSLVSRCHCNFVDVLLWVWSCLSDVRVKMSTEHWVILGLIMSSNTNSFHIHQSGCSPQEVHGATYPTPPFSLWFGSFEQCGPRQLVRTATSVTLPPGWRWGGDWRDGRDGRGAQRGVGGRRVQDDRLGRPTPKRFHKSRVSKQGSVSGR